MTVATHDSPSSTGRPLVQGAALLLAYALAAWVGLRFATLAGAASQLFPAAGVGLAGLILGGVRLWPAVFGGALAAAYLADLPLPWWARLGMAAGNVVGTVAAATLARRLRFSPSLERLSDVLTLAAVAAVLATVAAGSGALLLRVATGVGGDTTLGTLWRWWAGDIAGILVVAPPALAWSTGRRLSSASAAARRHAAVSIAFSLATAYALFGPWASSLPRAFLMIPALVWPAVAGGVRGASVALFGVASIVVWGSHQGFGPFGAIADPDQRMTLVQEFIAAAAATLLVLAVAADERRHARRRDQLAAELHASESRLRAILAATPECVKIVDADSRIEFMNDAGHRIVGLHSSAAGAAIGPMIAEEDRAAWSGMHHDVCQGERRQIRYTVVRTDGQRRVIDSIAVPIRTRDGRPGQLSISRDVTQQQQAEAALRLSEERFRGLFAASPLGIGVTSSRGELLFVSPAFCQLVGYSEQELIGQTYRLYTHPDDLAANLRLTESFRAGDSPDGYALEKRYVRKDGRVIWVNLTARPYVESGANDRCILFIAQDITERRLAEQAARAVESRLRAILDVTPGLFWICDSRGCATYISPRWDAYTGQSAADALGFGWNAVIHPDDLTRVRSAGDQLTGDRYEVECRYRTAQGVYRWQSCRAMPQYNAAGEIEAWYGLSVDIEDQRLVGQALRRTEEQLRWVAEAVGVGFWAWTGTHASLVTFDATAAALYGLPANQPIPGDLVSQRIDPADRAAVSSASRQSLSTGERLELEYRLAVPGRADIRWVASRGAVVTDDRNGAAVPGLAGVLWDITARKAAEVERTQLLESERAARLDAERASRLKDDFLSTVSHELRTPLNAIIGWSRVLLRHAATGDAELAEGLHVIDRNARAQTRLVEDLLDMSRITAGRLTIDPRPIDLRETLSAAVASVTLAARNKGVAIDLQIETPTLRLIGDPDRLQQVAWNLLSNAVKFTPAGGQIVVSAGYANARTRFAVRDTGEGFTGDFAQQIFDPFSQADSNRNRSRKGGGLGLGLSIARNLVELHGGTLTAESPGPGRGATFTVDLPTAGAPPAPTPQQAARGPAGSVKELRGISVLYVEDDADTRHVVARLLTDAGASVRTAASADDADRLLDEARPAVLISDIGLPDVDGYALLRRLRSRPAGQGGDLPAIAVTAFTRPEDRTQALRAGFQLHLAKPIDPTELIAAVASLATQWSSPAHTATPHRSPN